MSGGQITPPAGTAFQRECSQGTAVFRERVAPLTLHSHDALPGEQRAGTSRLGLSYPTKAEHELLEGKGREMFCLSFKQIWFCKQGLKKNQIIFSDHPVLIPLWHKDLQHLSKHCLSWDSTARSGERCAPPIVPVPL